MNDVLRVIDESLDGICAERLTPNLVWMARHLGHHGELRATSGLLDQLGTISISTVQRRLSRIHRDQPRVPRRKAGAGNRWLQDIPMKRLSWDMPQPGHCETDLVHHCGRTASGDYLCTLQMIDVATGWSERFAVMGRSYLVMKDAFLVFLTRLHFPVKEIHPDNGSAARGIRVL